MLFDLRIRKNGFVLLGIVFLFFPYLFFYTFLTTQREIIHDTAVYFNFYDRIGSLSYNYVNCVGFEPLFCYGSKVLSDLNVSPFNIHMFWSFVVITLMVVSILRFSDRYVVKGLLLVVPLTLNFFNPTEIFFLTRQFLAGAFLVNFFVSKNMTGKVTWGSLAFFSHFACLPLIILFVLSEDKFLNIVKRYYIKIILSTIFVGMMFPVELNLIRATLEYKFIHYQGKNDGAVSTLSEIKFIIYFCSAYYIGNRNLRLFLLYCAIFYLLTFLNPLAHLRYHKYLYFVFMYAFLYSVRIKFSNFVPIVMSLTLLRINSIVKWQTNGFGLEASVRLVFRYLLG